MPVDYECMLLGRQTCFPVSVRIVGRNTLGHYGIHTKKLGERGLFDINAAYMENKLYLTSTASTLNYMRKIKGMKQTLTGPGRSPGCPL